MRTIAALSIHLFLAKTLPLMPLRHLLNPLSSKIHCCLRHHQKATKPRALLEVVCQHKHQRPHLLSLPCLYHWLQLRLRLLLCLQELQRSLPKFI
ncbi:hypothetical protein AXX17_AT5G57910 [Arabidopsis thaliana]|uniref:Secreted protein n=1 Tax=Arabidopsis thaliana TaxID=3702 RepID=A0A178ULY4_ARATH|nr:hypothetical protein AXX17_AT5G57910 [Arabidopsis thaliana]